MDIVYYANGSGRELNRLMLNLIFGFTFLPCQMKCAKSLSLYYIKEKLFHILRAGIAPSV
jgi:hypothetical protein